MQFHKTFIDHYLAVALSQSYLASNRPIQIAENISCQTVMIPPGGHQSWLSEKDTHRTVLVATGKINVSMDRQKFRLGQGGILNVMPEMGCTVENRYSDVATVFVTTNHDYTVRGDDHTSMVQ
jgi:glyoxylate utilization-related uncharacterized protein